MRIKLTEKSLAAIEPPTDAAQLYVFDTELAGFVVVVGRTGIKTFYARSWVAGAGKKRKAKIGIAGRPRPDGHPWTVQLARAEAKKLLGVMAAGVDPNAERRKASAPVGGPTLRDAFAAHVAKQRDLGRSEATIATFEKAKKYLADWLDRPIAELRGAALIELHKKVKREARGRAGAVNERGAPLANRVITNIGTAWASLNQNLDGALGTWNPIKSVNKNRLFPRRSGVDNLADWYSRVQTMRNPVQRDGLVLALFTGLRSEDVRTIRHEHVDLDAWTLWLPDPKGGEEHAFTIPLSTTCVEILERRRAGNRELLLVAEAGGDGGWTFPAVDSRGKVGPIGDLRQQVHDGTKHGRFPVENVHALRHEFLSVAKSARIEKMDRMTLVNHRYSNADVHAAYIAQHIDHLRACADAIEAALWKRIGPERGAGAVVATLAQGQGIEPRTCSAPDPTCSAA